MDASGVCGCGVVFWWWCNWLGQRSGQEWLSCKELIQIVLSCAVWGPLLSIAIIDSINKGSSKELLIMHLLWCLLFFLAYFSIIISARYIPGVLCRSAFKSPFNGIFEIKPSRCHHSGYHSNPILETCIQDQTSSSFQHHFKHTINGLQAPH